MVFIPIYILILGFTIVIDYYAGIFLENAIGKQRKMFLIASLLANIGILAFFKYYNFLNDNINSLIHVIGYKSPLPYLSVLLPIGLSFHTFQAMSYTIEVYRGNQKAERHFGIYSLYVMFFPQLVAGPIERPQNLLHQFYEKHYFDYQRITDGLKLMAWGLFKKVVIADRLAIVVDNVYNNPHDYTGLSLIIATVFFSFQIFCDFSGYSDMAIGTAQVLGFKLMRNFNNPYHSNSIHEFWRRWHISLSSWFKDYLYISMGGNRVSIPRWYLNLLIVFLISGLWHGANLTFVIWGTLHGFYVIFALATQNIRNLIANFVGLSKYPRFNCLLQISTTFALTTFAWIFFRADSVTNAFYIINHLFAGLNIDLYNIFHHLSMSLKLGLTKTEFLLVVTAILFMEFVHIMQIKYSIREWIKTKPRYIRWSIYYMVIFLILFFGVYEKRQFIYFQF